MKYIYLILVSASFVFFMSSCQEDPSSSIDTQSSIYDPSTIDVIPLPSYVNLSDDTLWLSTQLNWTNNNQLDESAKQAVNTFEKQLMEVNKSGGNDQWSINISAKNQATEYPELGASEDYEIIVESKQVIINADNGIGVERALQSLSQLIKTQDDQSYLITGIIRDTPRYPWRGLMIDVVRHWIPMEILLQNIDAMAMAKMNVLHLHLTDDQGFRVESKLYPQLHESASKGLYYTQEDIKAIVKYAALRGIRIVPEFDLPGHSTSWIVAYPELASIDGQYDLKNSFGVFPNTLDPTNQEVYSFLEKFLEEMVSLFPDEYVHIGGHEVLPDQWKENESIQKFIKDKGLKNEYELQVYFNLRISEILRKNGKKMIGWDEILHPELVRENIIIQSWRGQESLNDAIRTGSRSILSSGWFLDLKLPAAELYAVDPASNASEINIEPDSSQWQSYQITTSINGIDQSGLLILFGDNDNLRGILNIMNRNTVIKTAQLVNDQLSFTIQHNVGEINAQLLVEKQNQSLSGVLQMAVGEIPVKGNKVGGSDMTDGMLMPKFVKQKPLTQAHLDLILGGEACIWTEWVTPQNINSRIWPIAAAVAEKLWSPQELSNDTQDFYRRLSSFDAQLRQNGIINDQLVDGYLSAKVAQDKIAAMKIYFNVLEEVKKYERWKYDTEHNMSTPLRQVADVVPVESMEAYRFNQLVSTYMDSGVNRDKLNLRQALVNWMPLYTQLRDELKNDTALSLVQFQCLVLSDFSKIADRLLEGQSLSKEELAYYTQLKEQIMIPRGAVELAVAPSLIRLIDHLLTIQ